MLDPVTNSANEPDVPRGRLKKPLKDCDTGPVKLTGSGTDKAGDGRPTPNPTAAPDNRILNALGINVEAGVVEYEKVVKLEKEELDKRLFVAKLVDVATDETVGLNPDSTDVDNDDDEADTVDDDDEVTAPELVHILELVLTLVAVERDVDEAIEVDVAADDAVEPDVPVGVAALVAELTDVVVDALVEVL